MISVVMKYCYCFLQACFDRAMELVGSEFMDRVKYYKESWFPARSIVFEAIEKRYDVSFSFHKLHHLFLIQQ